MFKKAFTVIEMAIVLVIIGIILGMAVKGGALLQSSKIKAELRKADKIKTAAATWRVNNPAGIGVFPRDPNDNSFLDIEHFVTLGYLSNADINNPFNQWMLSRGNMPLSGHNDILNINYGKTFMLHSNNVSPQFLCNFEVLSDDADVDNGTVRSTISDSNILKTVAGDWQECLKWNTAEVPTTFFIYELN
jgi:prepilin-type N-terminal cleavage/methylation domain-containing protein